MNADPANMPKPKRPWYRFTLRTFLIVILVVGGGSGWIASRLYEAARQSAAVAEIQAFHGFLFDDFHPVGIKTRANYFQSFGSVQFLGGKLTDADLDHLLPFFKQLPKLDQLILWYTQITDAGLECLSDLPQLASLDLGDTSITDAGLEHLKGLTNILLYGWADNLVEIA